MATKIIGRVFLETESGEAKPLSECSAEEIKKFNKAAADRLSNAMSLYYTQHPEEFSRL